MPRQILMDFVADQQIAPGKVLAVIHDAKLRNDLAGYIGRARGLQHGDLETLMATVEMEELERLLEYEYLNHLDKYGNVLASMDYWKGIALFGDDVAEEFTGITVEEAYEVA